MARGRGDSKGSKPDKIIRDALMLELNRYTKLTTGEKVKKVQCIVRKLVESGMAGKIDAIKEIFDRTEGKATQAIEHTDPNGGNPFAPLMELIAANGRPRPGDSR